MQRPLADEIRPKTLDEVVGQRHLLSPGAVLRRLIDSGTEANMVFYGPSGTGKTTIANIIARQTNKTLHRLNATTASLQDVKDIIADVGTLLAPGPAGIHGERLFDPHRLHHGEPVLLCVRSPAVPQHGV